MTIIFQTIAFVIAVRNSLCWREKKQREQIFARGMQQLSNESETAAILLRHDFTLLFPYSTAEMLVFLKYISSVFYVRFRFNHLFWQ